LILAFLVVVAMRPGFYLTDVPSLVFWVPMLTHLYTLFAEIISGAIFEPIFLFLVSFAMIIIALYLHQPTIKQMLSLM
jgi:hypothetical protein